MHATKMSEAVVQNSQGAFRMLLGQLSIMV